MYKLVLAKEFIRNNIEEDRKTLMAMGVDEVGKTYRKLLFELNTIEETHTTDHSEEINDFSCRVINFITTNLKKVPTDFDSLMLKKEYYASTIDKLRTMVKVVS